MAEITILHHYLFAKGRHPGRIATSLTQFDHSTRGNGAQAHIITAVDDELWPFDAEHFRWGEPLAVGAKVECLLSLAGGDLLVFAGEKLWRLASGQLSALGSLPGPVRTATQAADGRIYFAAGTGVYQLEL
jgi:hypothetical protein